MHIAERSPGVDVERIGRWLWRAVILAALLNIALIAALVVTQGEIPGVWRGGSNIAPGVLVRVAGAGLVARAAPDPGAAIVGDLPDGGTVRISGEAVQGPDGLWWPVEVETGEALTAGFVPESWLRAQ